MSSNSNRGAYNHFNQQLISDLRANAGQAGIELCWDRPPENSMARDENGHLTLGGGQLNLEGLLREGLDDGEDPPSPVRFSQRL